MSFDTLEYLVAEMPQSPQRLIVNRLGRARYTSHTNRKTFDHPEMGIYETVLPAEEVAALVRLLADTPLETLPDHWGRVPYGDNYRRIQVVAGADTVEKFVGTAEPVDPALQVVIDQLDRVVEQVIRHPLQTLKVALTDPVVDADGALTATMVLSATGSEVVNIRHPIGLPGASDGWLSIHLWPDRPDVRSILNVAVDEVEDLRRSSGRQAGDALLEIPPQGEATFRIHSSLPVKEGGAYLCRVSYATFVEEIAGRQVILGELLSRVVAVDVPVASEVGDPR